MGFYSRASRSHESRRAPVGIDAVRRRCARQRVFPRAMGHQSHFRLPDVYQVTSRACSVTDLFARGVEGARVRSVAKARLAVSERGGGCLTGPGHTEVCEDLRIACAALVH